MKRFWIGVLLAAALVQFLVTALPPGNDDLISIHSLALDLSRGDVSLLYPGKFFERNDEWIVHHEKNLRELGDRGQPNWCFYPPLVPYVTVPVASVSDDSWRLIWAAIQLGLTILFALLIERLLKLSGVATNRILIFALVLGCYPVARSVELGQTSLLIALLIWGAVYLAQTGKRWLSIVLAGMAIFVKPFLFVIAAVDAVYKRWTSVVGYVAIWILLLVLSIAAVGVYAHIEYWNLLSTLGQSQTAFYGNQSILGGLLRILSSISVTDYGFQADPTLSWLGRVIALGVLGFAGWAQIRSENVPQVLSYGMWFSAASLALPISWEHHLIFVIPALAFLWTQRMNSTWRGILIAATMLIEIRWTLFYGDTIGGRIVATLPMFGNLVLFIQLMSIHLHSDILTDEATAVAEAHVRA